MKLWPAALSAVALVIAFFGAFYFLGRHPGDARSGVLSKAAWQRMASPGELSRAHSFLEHNCAACHTPVSGVEAANCIACHANDQSLLQRQPSAFHATIKSCVECHTEHQGFDRDRTKMDHEALARIGLRELEISNAGKTNGSGTKAQIVAWIAEHRDTAALPPGHPAMTQEERALNCFVCHSNQDRHRGLFGTDCMQCHSTTMWNVPEFRHPAPTSTSCVQCHQAPPSHYMMHFKMISMTIAHQPLAQVGQCYLCHQTTSWNDIKGVGWYKHH